MQKESPFVLNRQSADDSLDLIRWLEEQAEYPKVYWRAREGGCEMAAAGARAIFETLPVVKEKSSEIFFGGMAFSESKSDPLWSDFPSCFFFSPKNLRIQKPYIPLKQVHPELTGQQDYPEFVKWERGVCSSLEAICEKRLQKVVLARRSSFSFLPPLSASPLSLLAKLQTRATGATLFYFQLTPYSAFLGATPEMLYERRGNVVTSDALAGTRPLGEKLTSELLNSPKERREFEFVRSYIHSRLSPLCSAIDSENTGVRKTATLQHLYSRFSGVLKESVTDRDLIKALHPTPAVAGTPVEAALDFLEQREPFSRGWYAAPVGWISSDEAHFAVAIRSALVAQKKVHLFSGTGIVQGSDPKREWEELEQKIALFL